MIDSPLLDKINEQDEDEKTKAEPRNLDENIKILSEGEREDRIEAFHCFDAIFSW